MNYLFIWNFFGEGISLFRSPLVTLIFEMEISHWIRNYNDFFYKLEKSAEFSQGYHISNWQVGHTIIGICHNRTFISDLLLLPSNSCNMSYGTNITGIPWQYWTLAMSITICFPLQKRGKKLSSGNVEHVWNLTIKIPFYLLTSLTNVIITKYNKAGLLVIDWFYHIVDPF